MAPRTCAIVPGQQVPAPNEPIVSDREFLAFVGLKWLTVARMQRMVCLLGTW